GGALLLAMTVSPVLCVLLLKRLRPARDNLLVRAVRGFYVWQLRLALRFRWAVLCCFLALLGVTAVLAANMGREFMPELEEGNLYIRGTFPVNVSFDDVSARTKAVRQVFRKCPEVEVVVPQVGRPDDGTDPTGYYNVEMTV